MSRFFRRGFGSLLLWIGAFLGLRRMFQADKVEGAEGVAADPMVQGVILAQRSVFIIAPRAQSYGLVPIAAAGLDHSLKQDGAAVSGGGVQGVVSPAGAGAAVELKPQTIQLLRGLDAMAAEGADGRPEAVLG